MNMIVITVQSMLPVKQKKQRTSMVRTLNTDYIKFQASNHMQYSKN